jgi:hypothetical protein
MDEKDKDDIQCLCLTASSQCQADDGEEVERDVFRQLVALHWGELSHEARLQLAAWGLYWVSQGGWEKVFQLPMKRNPPPKKKGRRRR